MSAKKGSAKKAKKATVVTDATKDADATEYRRAGASGGNAKSTITGRESAMYHFNKFLETKKMAPFDQLKQEELCCVTLFQEYGTYLSEFARKRRKVLESRCLMNIPSHNKTSLFHFILQDELLSWGTAKQFLSAPKEAAKQKFEGASIWVNTVWYTRIRCDIEATILRRCIELGVPVEDKSEPIGRDLLILLNDLMLTRGSVEDIEYRAALNMTFCAVGRAGECGLSTYNLAQYNTVYETFQLEWQEKKTLAQKPMNFFPDAERYEIDFYHSMACYWVVGAGSMHVSSATTATGIIMPIFPFLADGSAASKLTDYLQKLAVLTDNQIPAKVTATSLRVGGVQEVVNRTGDIVAGTIRGGWGGFLASVATIMEYYQQTHTVLSKGGRALAGWPDPNKHVHPPSCDPIFKDLTTHDQRTVFNNFLSKLFASSDVNIVSSKLRPFALVMFASLLQYLKPLIDKCSSNHIVVKTLVATAQEFDIRKKTLLRWGMQIDAQWRMRNVMNIANPADLAPVVTKLQTEILQVKEQNAELKIMLTEIRQEQLRAARDTNDKFAKLFALLTVQDTDSSDVGSKRMRLGTDVQFASSFAAATPLSTSGSESTALIASSVQVPQNAFTALKQVKAMVEFAGKQPLSTVLQLWYSNKLTPDDNGVRWTAPDKRDKTQVKTAVKYLESLWPDNVRDVLQAASPERTSSQYLHWNTSLK